MSVGAMKSLSGLAAQISAGIALLGKGRALRYELFESELRAAVARDEVTVEYQGQWDLNTGTLVGVESLARWRHLEWGDVSPALFVSIAERDDLIVSLGRQVFKKVLADIQHWDRISFEVKRVAINVSPIELDETRFADSIVSQVKKAGIEPRRICFEVTESAVVSENSRSLQSLVNLRDAGFQVAIDNFGTGNANLCCLRYQPAQILKIDRSFLQSCIWKHDDQKIIQGLIFIAHSLGMETIAEGIECEEQAHVLLTLGCDMGQGYYLSRPLPRDAISMASGTVIQRTA